MNIIFISDDVLNYIRRLEDRLGITDHPTASDKSVGDGEGGDGDMEKDDWRRPEAVSNAFKVRFVVYFIFIYLYISYLFYFYLSI